LSTLLSSIEFILFTTGKWSNSSSIDGDSGDSLSKLVLVHVRDILGVLPFKEEFVDFLCNCDDAFSTTVFGNFLLYIVIYNSAKKSRLGLISNYKYCYKTNKTIKA